MAKIDKGKSFLYNLKFASDAATEEKTFVLLVRVKAEAFTGPGNNTCTWFGEVGICCCLPLLPQLACNILATAYKYYFRA